MTPRLAFIPVAALLLEVVLVALAQPPAKGKKVALVVGVNRYHHADLNKPKPLEFAEKDVADLEKELTAAGYAVTTLAGKEATLAAIREKLDALRKLPGEGGVFLVALAGHGLQPEVSKDAYFCPFDADQRFVPANDPNPKDPWDYKSLLPLADVLGYLKASTASTRVLMVDACRNDPTSGRGRGVGSGLQVGDLPENTAVLLSCSRGQRAYEDKAWGGGHGAFFHHVLEGMREKGRDKKGRVTADSLWEYVREAVPEDVATVIKEGAEQKPFRLVTGDVDFQIAATVARPQAPGPSSGGDLAAGEKAEEFEYVIEGEKRKGTRRVVKVDIEGGASVEFVRISKGSFMMGAPAGEKEADDREKPQHKVEISQDFYLAKFELTQAQYRTVTGESPSNFKGDNLPVEKVSHDEAVQFCKKVSGTTGRTIVLPTEAQWEYACRAGTTTPFHFGSKLNGDLANCNGNYPYGTEAKGAYNQTTVAVGSYPANPWGLHDMHGNVYEWCSDWYKEYSSENLRDPLGPGTGSDRVFRGGSWVTVAGSCRSADRFGFSPGDRYDYLGFRLALVP